MTMALPKIQQPIFEFTLPSNKKKTLKYRPFIVKEQKLLLMALESKEEKSIVETIKQIIQNCVLTENFNVNDLTTFDLEYFFLQLRARSIGEIVKGKYVCNNLTTDPINSEQKKCGNMIDVEYNLLDTKVEFDPTHSQIIKFDGKNLGIVMKYPSISSMETIAENKKNNPKLTQTGFAFDFIVECIESIFEGETVYLAKDCTKEELMEFIETLSKTDFDKLENFFNTLPSMKQLLKFSCPKCNFNHEIELEGLQSFFA